MQVLPLYKNEKISFISQDKIFPNPQQPRRSFDEETLKSLARSIESYGLLQPISVRRAKNDYELVAGERRLRACRMIGLDKIPCIIIDTKPQTAGALALVENLQRQELNCFDEAEGIKKLIENYNLTQEQVASQLGMSQSAVANKLRILRYNDIARLMMMQYCFTERHARALLKLPPETDLLQIIETVGRKGYSVAQTEQLVLTLLKPQKPVHTKKYVIKDMRIFTNTINKALTVLRSSGLNCEADKIENEDSIIYTIRVPKAQ